MNPGENGLFVTGTDTGIGKTRVALGLMDLLQRRGLRVVGMKPVATGCEYVEGVLGNDDARRLQRASSGTFPYECINPYAFEPPVSPNIAAELAGHGIDLGVVVERYHFLQRNSDRVIVEGVGGWEVPLNDRERVSDLARLLGLPVILVVGLRLGCLNHAILSERSILAAGVDYRGWFANAFSKDFARSESNVRTLRTCMSGAFLGHIPYCAELAGTGVNYRFLNDLTL